MPDEIDANAIDVEVFEAVEGSQTSAEGIHLLGRQGLEFWH